MARPLTMDHLRSRKKPNFVPVTIVLDPEKAEEFSSCRYLMEAAKLAMKGDPGDEELVTAYTEAQAAFKAKKTELEDDLAEFKFRSIGRKKYDKIVNDHPASNKQIEKEKSEAARFGVAPEFSSWNGDTFPPALLHAAAVNSELTIDDWNEIWNSDEWSHIELTALMGAAFEANSSRRMVDLGND